MFPAIPTPIPMPFAQNGERRTIPETNTTPGSADASWATGFPPVTRINKQAGGKPPYGLDFQGIFHTICEHLFFSQSGNTPPWVGASEEQPGLNYLKGAIVQGSDGETYMALKPSGPDAPNPDGGSMVGPVDPVGDESGHWINLKLLFAGSPNSELWITESGTFEAPVKGWYEVLCIDGGNGAFYNTGYSCVVGGASGVVRAGMVYLEAGESVEVTVGAGGVGASGTVFSDSQLGGVTTFGDHELAIVGGSFRGTQSTAYGPSVPSGINYIYAIGGGPGGGGASQWKTGDTQAAVNARNNAIFYGGGGGASLSASKQYAVGSGKQGVVLMRWHDPAKAAGPLPAPALFSARRLAPRASVAPATINLYDPETGQGSVWRAEDAEAKLADGLITEAAWLEICAARAAEAHAAWIADPETGGGRFELLRAARDARLAATDYLVAPDYPLADDARAAVTAYRQVLRDLPAQEGAPWDGGGELTPWPEAPVVGKETAAE